MKEVADAAEKWVRDKGVDVDGKTKADIKYESRNAPGRPGKTIRAPSQRGWQGGAPGSQSPSAAMDFDWAQEDPTEVVPGFMDEGGPRGFHRQQEVIGF